MTREMKYGLIVIIGLLIIAPIAALVIKLCVLLFGLMLNHPVYVLVSIVSAFIGGGISNIINKQT